MTDLFMIVAPISIAYVWIILQQRRLNAITNKLELSAQRLQKAEQRLHSTKLTLTSTKNINEELTQETLFLKGVLFDVAKGEAHVWIEDDELRATRTVGGEISIH